MRKQLLEIVAVIICGLLALLAFLLWTTVHDSKPGQQATTYLPVAE
jgi:hypothetical protein